jgi:hypothetical protein
VNARSRRVAVCVSILPNLTSAPLRKHGASFLSAGQFLWRRHFAGDAGPAEAGDGFGFGCLRFNAQVEIILTICFVPFPWPNINAVDSRASGRSALSRREHVVELILIILAKPTVPMPIDA